MLVTGLGPMPEITAGVNMFKDIIPGGGTGSGDKPPKDVTATTTPADQPAVHADDFDDPAYTICTTVSDSSTILLALVTGGKERGVDWDHLVDSKQPKTGLNFALEMFKFAKERFKPSGKEPSNMLGRALDTGIKVATEVQAMAAKGTDISFHLPSPDDEVVKGWQKEAQDSNELITVLNSTVSNSNRTKVRTFYFAHIE